MWNLISATPSPYARKVRIALAKKDIPFTLLTEVPWDSNTKTPLYNPLEKLPVLILDDDSAVYESHYILEWLEAKYPNPPLLPAELDARLFAKKVEVVCDGMCDALVIAFFEGKREAGMQSKPWKARQMRKAAGGLKQLAEWVDERGHDAGTYLIGDSLTLADLAIGSVLGWLTLRWSDHGWQEQYPGLKKYHDGLEALKVFRDTRPAPQTMKDQIV